MRGAIPPLSPRLHGVVVIKKSTGTTLPLPLPLVQIMKLTTVLYSPFPYPVLHQNIHLNPSSMFPFYVLPSEEEMVFHIHIKITGKITIIHFDLQVLGK
jgi:hypothetical protein